MLTSLQLARVSSLPSSESVDASASDKDSPTAHGYSSEFTSRVKVSEASVELHVSRDTRSYFWALIAVIVKVSSKRSGSDMVGLVDGAGAGLVWREERNRVCGSCEKRIVCCHWVQWMVVLVYGGRVEIASCKAEMELVFLPLLVPPITIRWLLLFYLGLCLRCASRMSFRKRNIGLSPGGDRTAAPSSPTQQAAPELALGIRPSPDDGRPATSTGTASLDNLLAGHAGLPMGKLLLIEENGTTDFAGALLRYYAAEGVVQEHKVHVVGVPEQWGRSLPGLIGSAESLEEKKSDKRKDDRMKIAWRYERLGEFGTGVAGSRNSMPVKNIPIDC